MKNSKWNIRNPNLSNRTGIKDWEWGIENCKYKLPTTLSSRMNPLSTFCVLLSGFFIFSFWTVFAATPGVGSYVHILKDHLTTKSENYKNQVLDALWWLELHMTELWRSDKARMYHELRRGLDTNKVSEVNVIHDNHLGITMTRASDIYLLYMPSTPFSVGKIFETWMWDAGVNASFFSRREHMREHAGLLYMFDSDYGDFVSSDPNITHIVCRRSDGTIHFIHNDAYFPELRYGCQLAFQVWPMVLHGGVFYEQLGSSTFDASGHERTLLMVVEDELWFVTVRSKLNLWNIGNYIMNTPEFRHKSPDLINLDGGSSVVYYNARYTWLNYGIEKKLPLIFGIKYP